MEKNTDPNSTEGGPNTSGQSTRTNNNQTTSERAERCKYKIPILSDRERPDKNQPQNVVGANIRVYTSDIQSKPG